MNELTDAELDAMWDKLKSGFGSGWQPVREYARAVIAADRAKRGTIEECAAVCDAQVEQWNNELKSILRTPSSIERAKNLMQGALNCAIAIRALKSTKG